MKRLLFVLLLTFLTVGLLACKKTDRAAAETAASDGESAPQLAFRITWTDYSGRGQAIQKIVDSYNAISAEDEPVQMIGGNEDQAAIEKMLTSSPETVFVLPYRYVQYFGYSGKLMDLTNSFTEEMSLFYEKLWNLGTAEGKVYGIPWLGHSMCLLYNKTLLDTAGVDASSLTSLDALVQAMEQVEQYTDAQGIGLVGAESNDVSWMVNQFIYGFGGSLVDESGKNVVINSPESAAALAFYKDVLGAHAQPTWTEDTGVEVMRAFLNQEVAFEIQGIWGVTDVQKNGEPFEVGVVPLSRIGLNAEVGPMMLSLPAGISGEGKEQAISFIRYMISMDAQQAILNGEYSPEHDQYYPFRTPIRLDMADTPMMRLNPDYQLFIEGFEHPSVDVPVPKWQTVKDDYYQAGLHRVMIGETSIDAFLRWIESEGNRILSEP
ncbi:MAG TPA: extracellular solute-binding protein [Candidatus Cryosericum sp.]|nr:extracellular solute-binding protein [Candidatus Cryosericum sp.]